MAAKQVLFVALALFVAQGQSVTEVFLPDETTTHLSNPLIPKTISLPRFFLDTLINCYVIFPNGAMFETLPNNSLQGVEFVETLSAQEPFNGCGIGFRNAPPSMSGTYELLSRVDHFDGTSTLTRQKFHLTFYYSDSWGIPSK